MLEKSIVQMLENEPHFPFRIIGIDIPFGAPFCFDLLNNLVSLRSAGKFPDESTTQKRRRIL